MINNLLNFILNPILNDAPEPWQIGFQDSAAPGFEGIIDLHDSIFFYLVVISIGVFWVLISVIINFSQKNSPIVYKYSNHGTLIELIWTITPALVLIAIAFPSFRLLYMLVYNIPITRISIMFLCYLFWIILGIIIKKDFLGNKFKYFVKIESSKILYKNKIFIILFTIILFFLLSKYFYNYIVIENIIFNPNKIQLDNVIFNMFENSTNSGNNRIIDASEGVINVNNPIANISIPKEAARVIGIAIASAGGIGSGIKLAQQMPNAGGKALAVVGSVVLSQVANITVNKYLDSDTITKNNVSNKLISNFNNVNIDPLSNNKYPNFPLNLIPDLAMYVNIEIMFLTILCNVLFTSFLIEKNKLDFINVLIDKYIKNERINSIVKFAYLRYIKIWSISKWVLIVWSLVCIIICIIISRIILITLLS